MKTTASNFTLKFHGVVLLRYFVMLQWAASCFSVLVCCLRSGPTFLNFRYLNNSSFCVI